MRFKSVFAGVMAVCTALMQCPVQAAGQVLPNMPTQMNLGSQAKTYVVPAGFTPTTIRVNNHAMQVGSGMALTPAEAVALQQVLTTGHQSIILNAFGAASGGTFNLPMSEVVNSLTIPGRVTVLRDFSNNTALNLTGIC